MNGMDFPIDLSALTPEEQKQFEDDMTTLYDGDTNVCLYLRFSSDRQSEQSIEGQLRDCIAYCKRLRYRITGVFVDRATTARKDTDKRVAFQYMINESSKHRWEKVIVWKLDRFSRSREDSAIYKMRLRKCGVKVESATEAINDSPEGIILEAVLEGIAEYYSADLSQKITRGMRESALKGNNIGGRVPLGYKLVDRKLVVDPATAPIVVEAFELYASGESIASISRIFNDKGYRTSTGKKFTRSSFHSMFNNERYIGVYTYKDNRVENGVPPIVPKELFDTVQHRVKQTKNAPARGKAKVDYLLAGKVFCGHCGSPMNGESGTSKTGAVYNYYTCYERKRRRGCDKKSVRKEWLEDIVIQDAFSLLTDEIIDELADMAMRAIDEDIEKSRINALIIQIEDLEKRIDNLLKALEKGAVSDTLTNRISELESEKKALETTLAHERTLIVHLEKVHIVYWLSKFKDGDIQDENFRRKLVDLLINSVTLYDDPDGFRITIAYNLTDKPTNTFHAPLEKGSDFNGLCPPIGAYPNTYFIIGSNLFLRTMLVNTPS